MQLWWLTNGLAAAAISGYPATPASVGVDEGRQAGKDTLKAKGVGVNGAVRAAVGSSRR